MNILKIVFARLQKRVSEVYFRAIHASNIFSKRFFTLLLFGHVDLDQGFGLDENKAVDRGSRAPDGRFYSKFQTVEWTDLPISIKQAIRNYDSVLRIFSQHWHYDKVVDFRNIQLFVLLGDVTLDDGPFEYVANPNEYRILPSVVDRNNKDLQVLTGKFIGKRGDTCLFSTGSTPHRAGIPAYGRQRDMFSIAFFPAYTKIGCSSTELLAQV
jgi:hypothetical protein